MIFNEFSNWEMAKKYIVAIQKNSWKKSIFIFFSHYISDKILEKDYKIHI